MTAMHADRLNRWPVSATQWIFGAEDLEVTVARLARLGYDGIELSGDPDRYDAGHVREILERHELRLTSICGMYPPERDLSSPDPEVRATGIRYIRRCSELASSLGASIVIVVPGSVGRVTPLSDAAREWELAILSISHAADEVAGLGVRLVIEALNRYESYFLGSLRKAAQLAAAINRENVGIMADLFHMNIEERDLAEAVRTLAPSIWHVHLADSNRRPPGLGHTNFGSVLRVLQDVSYQGALAMEFMPSISNPYDVASLNVPEEEKSADARQAIDHIRNLLVRRGEDC